MSVSPIVTLPVVPGETPGDRLVRIIKGYVGCSLSNRRDELGVLVARGVDDPKRVVTIATNCGMTALGVMALAGVQDAILNKPYVSGMAISWLRQIGIDLGALMKYIGPNGPQPKVGSLLRYNTHGKNDDHVEWLLTSPIKNVADHAGGGRSNNAITLARGLVTWNVGRPLVEFWDPDKLGIPTLPQEQAQEET